MPVLAIAAHIPSSEIGTTYFQETHPQELFRECSAYCEPVSTPAQLPFVLHTAVRTALEIRIDRTSRWWRSPVPATSADLPGVSVPGAPFMGTIGLSPGHDLLAARNALLNMIDHLTERGSTPTSPLAMTTAWCR